VIRVPLAVLLLGTLSASAQYVPPIPKTITGGRALNRTKDIPLPSPNQQWVRARSKHFLTLSGAGERRTREIVNELETVAAALRLVDPRFAAEGELTRMILIAKTRDATPYFELLVGRSRSAGAFVTNSEGTGTMLIDASRNLVDGTVFHELVHNLLANSGTRLPLWLEEGMAEYFSTAEVMSQSVRFGKTLMARSYTLRNRPMLSLADLFAVQPESEAGSSDFFYAESWAVVDWLMRADRVAFFKFVDDVNRGTPAVEALRGNYHIEPSLIERTLQIGQSRPPVRMTVRIETGFERPVVEPIDNNTVVIELATFLGGFEATRGDAERFLDSVIASDPKNGQAFAAKAALRSKERKYDDAAKLYEQALQLAPSDAEIRLAFAESLLGNAIGPFSGTADIEEDAAQRFRRARQLATEALAAGADPARANAVIGTSYLVEKDPTPGIEPLLRARGLRPNRYDIALNLYTLLLRSGDRGSADSLYKEIVALAKTSQANFAARAVYVREQLALVNRLIGLSQIDDAMAILTELIDATPDPNAKMDLKRQLLRLRDIGEANRQIMTYNEAVQAANRGETQKAIGILDKLLETANDPAVIRDATAFRKLLQKRVKPGMHRS
jgi:tetratricopeptide (TPR) repeat protein